ncbi:MAG: hypothetical protein WAX79_07475, partial [Candidatus Omnitrophota bacterium]
MLRRIWDGFKSLFSPKSAAAAELKVDTEGVKFKQKDNKSNVNDRGPPSALRLNWELFKQSAK